MTRGAKPAEVSDMQSLDSTKNPPGDYNASLYLKTETEDSQD